MRTRMRKVVRAAVVALFATLPIAMAPCDSSLQYPPSDTETVWGVAIAEPG